MMDFSNIVFPPVLFMTGIGTDVGKSFATGWLAKEMIENGISCITQKMIQTGNTGRSEDIDRHRKIMGMEYLPEDTDRTTAPIIFTYPASPHLAAKIDGEKIDLNIISAATRRLVNKYDHVIVEGAGGLMVPIEGTYLTADYIRDHSLPVVVTVRGQLGSINHALLTFNAVKSYGLNLFAVIYNPYFDKDEVICKDTRSYLKDWLLEYFPQTLWIEMSKIS